MRAFVLLLALAPALNATDFKIVTVWHRDVGNMVGNQNQPVRGPGDWTQTEYVKGPWRRRDAMTYVGGRPVPDRPNRRMPYTAEIANCDTHDEYRLDLDAHKYTSGKLQVYPSEDRREYITAPRPSSSALEFDTVDTGETATMFGYRAHRLITTVKVPPNEEAKRQGWTQVIVDAWYIPLEVPSTDCKPAYMSSNIAVMLTSLNQRPYCQHTGPVPQGLAVKMITRSRNTQISPNGNTSKWVTTSEWEVTELSQSLLDPSLFSVPRKFKRVKELPY